MPDTCLDTTPSQSLDVRLLRTVEHILGDLKSVNGGVLTFQVQNADWLQYLADVREIASEIRATIHRPGKQAHDLIQCLRASVDLDDAIFAARHTLRCLPTGDQARVALEIEVIRAERERARQGEMAR